MVINRLASLPIKQKLTVSTLGIALLVLFIMSFAFISSEFYSNRTTQVEAATTLTRILAVNSTAAVAFDDAGAATEVLGALKEETTALSATIYNLQGKPFVHYIKSTGGPGETLLQLSPIIPVMDPDKKPYNRVKFIDDTMIVYHDINESGRLIGFIEVRLSLEKLKQSQQRLMLIGLLSALAGVLLAYFFATKLQTLISHPIETLANTMAHITAEKDYSRRAQKYGDDELGKLTEGFNAMLEQIQIREVELKKTNEDLLQTQEQLVQSAKLASVGELATGVAHELNQPLGIISMSVDLQCYNIKKGHPLETQQTYELVLRQIERASTIINHLRTFGREADTSVRTANDPNKLISDAFIMLNEQLRLHDIVVVKEFADDLPDVNCNLIQIEQVLTNLIMNAKDALNLSVEKKITVRTRRLNASVVIEVEDTGEGIESTDLDRIFDPFFTTKEVGKGTGLGLSISYGIIENHQGKLSVSTIEGKGTTFFIELPAIEEVTS